MACRRNLFVENKQHSTGIWCDDGIGQKPFMWTYQWNCLNPCVEKKNTPHFQKKWWTETLGLIIFEGKKTVNSTSMFSMWKQETRGEQEFLSKHQEALLYYAVSEHWNRLPGEALETLSMEIFKSHLDVVLDNLLLLFGLSRGVEPDVLQRSIPISTILWLYDSVCNQQVD